MQAGLESTHNTEEFGGDPGSGKRNLAPGMRPAAEPTQPQTWTPLYPLSPPPCWRLYSTVDLTIDLLATHAKFHHDTPRQRPISAFWLVRLSRRPAASSPSGTKPTSSALQRLRQQSGVKRKITGRRLGATHGYATHFIRIWYAAHCPINALFRDSTRRRRSELPRGGFLSPLS